MGRDKDGEAGKMSSHIYQPYILNVSVIFFIYRLLIWFIFGRLPMRKDICKFLHMMEHISMNNNLQNKYEKYSFMMVYCLSKVFFYTLSI